MDLTPITIKRYTGGSWVEYAPATTIAQVDGLQAQLNAKQPLLSFDNTPTPNSDNPVKSGGIFNAIEVAKKSATYVTDVYADGEDLCLVFTNSVSGLQIGGLFPPVDNSTTHAIEIHDLIENGANYNYLLTKSGSYLVGILYLGTGDIPSGVPEGTTKLRVGNNVYITDTDVPDLWLGYEKNSTGPAEFYPLETEHPDLTPYITGVSYDTSSHKIKYTKSAGDTEVVDLDDFASMTDAGAITIGGKTKTPIYSHQPLDNYSTKANTVKDVSYSSGKLQKTMGNASSATDIMELSLNSSTGEININGTKKTPIYSHQPMYYRPIKVGGDQKLANTVNTALDFMNPSSGYNVVFTWDTTSNGIKANVNLSSYAPKASPTFTGTVTMPFTSAGFVKTNASGVLSVDGTSYTPTTRTINGLDLSANRTLYAETVYANKTVIGNGSSAPSLGTGRSYYEGDLWFKTS